jgi:hypothetical protein
MIKSLYYSFKPATGMSPAVTTCLSLLYLIDIEQSQASSINAIASLAPKNNTNNEQTKPLITSQEMISELRGSGLPVSAIADAMRVERKSIYSWLSGGDMRNANTQRAAQIHALFTGVDGVDARGLYRFWNTPIDCKKTLRDLMAAEIIDVEVTVSALNKLRPAALRAMENERKMAQQGTSNPALDDIPDTGANG